MSQSLGYHLYHFKGILPVKLQEQLNKSNENVSFLKKPLKESTQSIEVQVDVNAQPSEKLDIFTLKNYIIIRRFFSGSPWEQVFIAVPVDSALMMKDESALEFQQRIIDESDSKLKNVFGVNYHEDRFNLVSSFIIFLQDEKVFSDNKSYYESISQFITHSYKIKSEQYVNVDNYQIVIDYEGVGILFSNLVDLTKIGRFIFVQMLAKAYLAALEAISLGTAEPLDNSQNFFQEAENIERSLDEFNRFLIRYYYHNPILVDVNKTFLIYEMIKDALKLREQYNETKEQVRILSELANAKRRQIAEMMDSMLKQERQTNKRTVKDIMLQFNQLIKLGLGIISFELLIILALLLF